MLVFMCWISLHVYIFINKVLFILKREVSCVLCSQVNVLICDFVTGLFNSVFTIFWDFNIQCRVYLIPLVQ